MNEEKRLLTTTYFGRVSKKGLAFTESSAPIPLFPMVTELTELPKQSCTLSPDGRYRFGLAEC